MKKFCWFGKKSKKQERKKELCVSELTGSPQEF